MTTYPYELVYDVPQHNVLGITFDEPIPWPRWERGTDERIAAAVRGEEDPESPTSISNIGSEIEDLRFWLKKEERKRGQGSREDLLHAMQAAVDKYDEWVKGAL